MNSKFNCIIFIKKWINLTSRILGYTNLCKHLINPLKPLSDAEFYICGLRYDSQRQQRLFS
jgi:hypothetical protein